MAIVLITGTSTGIGRALAHAFADRGDTVYATMRDVVKAGDLAGRENVFVEALDVTEPQSVERAVREVVKRSGRIDVLINNAAIDVMGAFEDLHEEACYQVLETNFWGAVRMTRACLPIMRAQRSGTIVMVTSVGAMITVPSETFYAASKRALEAAAEGLQHEVSRFGIRICVVQPGFVRTPMNQKVDHLAASPPDSPYRKLIETILRDQEASMHKGASPEATALEICAAVCDSEAFSTPIGDDARVMVPWRRRQEEPQYFAKAPRKFGFDWWTTGENAPLPK